MANSLRWLAPFDAYSTLDSKFLTKNLSSYLWKAFLFSWNCHVTVSFMLKCRNQFHAKSCCLSVRKKVWFCWLYKLLCKPEPVQRKCVIVWFPHGVDMCMMSCLSAVSPKQSVPGINIVTSVLSLDDRTLEKAFLDSGKLDLGLVSASSNGIEP